MNDNIFMERVISEAKKRSNHLKLVKGNSGVYLFGHTFNCKSMVTRELPTGDTPICQLIEKALGKSKWEMANQVLNVRRT